MKAFISYSHADTPMLELLHKHLAQLQRDGIITTWTDREITAGANLDHTISTALNRAQIFLALLSPDYIASNYCYEIEFETALEMQEKDEIIIIPIIVESCDWLSTPFSSFKALPKDGKAVSQWDNKNTAFLDVVQNIRKLVSITNTNETPISEPALIANASSRNYRIQRDFDSIEKIQFVEKTFHEVKEYLKRYIEEIKELENIKVMPIKDTFEEIEYILVNRNKIATESQLLISTKLDNNSFNSPVNREKQISYSIFRKNYGTTNVTFNLSFDEYHLFWRENNFFVNSNQDKELMSKDISDLIWSVWLESVGIL